jgi:hypothetical protein
MKTNKKKQLMPVLMLAVILFAVGFNRATCEEAKNYKENVNNFISFQEMDKDEIIQGCRLGDFYLTDIDMKNQLKIIIDTAYLETAGIDVKNKRIKIAPAYELNKRTIEELKTAEVVFIGNRILANDPIVYYIDELGLQEDDKLKISVSFEEQTDDGWIILSADAMKFRVKKVGLKMDTSETLAFVRDSFSRSWKPQPGTSVTFGFTPYITRKTNCIDRIIGKTWKFFDPRIGVNLTLLDFDADKNLEIGLGPVLSFLKGTFYIGVGWNFSTSRNKNQYALFGMSISEITTTLKSLITK